MEKNENVPENKPEPAKDSQSVLADSLKLMESVEPVKGTTPRQTITIALLLGVCFVFLAAMLGVQRIDTPLTVALVAFSLAIPALGFGLLFSFYKPPTTVPGWRIFASLYLGAWVIEGLGGIAVAVGVYYVILHLSPLASLVFLLASAGVFIVTFVGSIIGLLIYALVRYRKQKLPPQTMP